MHPWRSFKVTTGPTVEPVTLTDMLGHLRLGAGDPDESYVRALIAAARQTVEQYTGRLLLPQTVRVNYDGWPSSRTLVLPFAPLRGITSLEYVDNDGTVQTFAASNYAARTDDEPGALELDADATWPTHRLEAGAVRVTATFGYDDGASVPEALRQWIMVRAATMYENREAVAVGMTASRVPMALSLAQWRVQW